MIWPMRSMTRQLWFEHGSGVAKYDDVTVALNEAPRIAGLEDLSEVHYVSRQPLKARIRRAGEDALRLMSEHEVELIDAALKLMRTQGRAALGL